MWRGWNEIAFLAGYFELASALKTVYGQQFVFPFSLRSIFVFFFCYMPNKYIEKTHTKEDVTCMHSDMSFAVDLDIKQHYNIQRKPG